MPSCDGCFSELADAGVTSAAAEWLPFTIWRGYVVWIILVHFCLEAIVGAEDHRDFPPCLLKIMSFLVDIQINQCGVCGGFKLPD